VPGRVTIFDGKTLAPLGEIMNGGGNGAVVDAKSGHGFASSHPDLTMFDIRTKQDDQDDRRERRQPNAQPRWSADGIYFDPSDNRVYIGSHPTKDLIVLDVNDGKVYGKIPLGGVPEQTVSDGKGTLYVALQDSAGGVAVVDQKAMKVTKTFPIGDIGRCNGLAIDVKNAILFIACAQSRENGPTPQPMMTILSAKDGKILAKLPLAGASDGAVFNPKTMEAFSSQGNGTLTVIKEKSPTEFEVEQNLETMNGARTLAFEAATGNIFVMSVERAPTPPGGRGAGPAVPGSFTIVRVGKP
jgi:DNA-binding beta-propeller fold protein YncE